WRTRQHDGLAREAGQRFAPMAARLAARTPDRSRSRPARNPESGASGRAGKPAGTTRSAMMRMNPAMVARRWVARAGVAAIALLIAACSGLQADSRQAGLPSWNDGPARQ